ncbi:MAG TPA: nickel transporter [Caldimonas sp.]|nr:nickel transporter [Caldimonas sp.]
MSTPDLLRDFIGLAAVVLLLGLRHGFDADHLAAIDALACHNAGRRPRVARLSGVLFSLGHGLVVVGVALGVSLLAQAWRAPQWLEATGVWVSVVALTLLALVNIVAVVQTPHDERTRLVGLRSGLFGRLLRAEHPLAVLGVGVVFALSFDTISQAALFAMTAAAYGGWRPALVLGLIFTTGMLLTDGVNGWLIWRLVHHSERTARVASRTVALAVSGVGLLTAGLALATRFMPAAQVWAEGKELWFGGAVVGIVLASFLVGQRLARAAPAFAGERSR